MAAFSLFFLFCLLAAASEAAFRAGFPEEPCRKASHILGGVAFAAGLMLAPPWHLLGLGVATYAAYLAARRRKWLTILERASRPGRGELAFGLGLASCWAASFWDPRAAVAAVLVASLADGLAPLGARCWKLRLAGHKTAGGTLTFFALALAVLLALYPWGPLLPAVALLLALAELFTGRGWDNLAVPVLALALLALAK